MSSPTLLVLAAGMGSRYGGLKQMEPVGPAGETIIDYSIHDALRAGFGKLVFVIRRDFEDHFKKAVGARFERHVSVEYVYQELDHMPSKFQVPPGRTKPWGTAYAILTADNTIQSPFAVINADDFYGAESYRVLAHHLQCGTEDYSMVGFILRNTLSEYGKVARGVCRVSDDGFLENVVEYTDIQMKDVSEKSRGDGGRETGLSGDEVVSMNMWGFTPRIFGQLREQFQLFLERNGRDLRAEFYIPSAVSELVHTERARVKVLRTNSSWFGVTYREDRARVVEGIRRLVDDGSYPKELWT